MKEMNRVPLLSNIMQLRPVIMHASIMLPEPPHMLSMQLPTKKMNGMHVKPGSVQLVMIHPLALAGFSYGLTGVEAFGIL